MSNQKKLSSFFIYSFSMLPLILIYMGIFISSMGTAFDRQPYLRIVTAGNESRIEPLLPIISDVLGFLVSDPFVKLTLIQLFFFSLFLKALYDYLQPKQVEALSKCCLALLLCIIIYSNPFGVQLRMGYATILFVYLVVTFRKLNILFFIPVFMHYGTSLAILLIFYVFLSNINTRRRFIIHSAFMLTIFTILFSNIDAFFRLIGVSAYYFMYLKEEAEFGRSVPYSAVFYIILCFYIIINPKKKGRDCWFALSGLWLIYVGFFLDFYLAFKMLYPISMYALFYTVKILPENQHPYVYTLIAFILAPLTFYYFALQVNLI